MLQLPASIRTIRISRKIKLIAVLLFLAVVFTFKRLALSGHRPMRLIENSTERRLLLDFLELLDADDIVSGKTDEKPALPIFEEHAPTMDQCIRVFYEPQFAKELMEQPLTVNSTLLDASLNTSCENIRKRRNYRSKPRTILEQKFPLAFVRIVKEAYHIQELLFAMMYAPQNLYCYTVDQDASTLFRKQMQNLSKCFPNVLLTNFSYKVDKRGHNVSRSFLECLKLLESKSDWKYVILLENDDFPLKTNAEMVQILMALNGSNNVGVRKLLNSQLPTEANFSLSALKLFKFTSWNQQKRWINATKGSTSMSLSRSFVEFILRQLNLDKFLRILDSFNATNDDEEVLFSSLHSFEFLDAPGSFTTACVDPHDGYFTRHKVSQKMAFQCQSGQYIEDSCVFGIADLAILAKTTQLFASRMLPSKDYGAIACWARYLTDRALSIPDIDLSIYRQNTVVRFNDRSIEWRRNISSFQC